MLIGITGGIGSGKSTLAQIIRDKGYPVFDSDTEARKIQNNDQQVIQSTKELFGEDVYKGGELDRKWVASQVFKDSEKLRALTNIVHPAVRDSMVKWAQQYSHKELLFIESAVLFEGGFYRLMDKIILVTAPESIRIQRVMQRDGISEAQVIERIKSQIPDEEKIPDSDLIINTEHGIPSNILELIIMWK